MKSKVPTVRDRLKAIQDRLLPGDVTPAIARQSLMTLTALLGPVLDEKRAAAKAYHLVLADAMAVVKTKAAAEIQAQTTAQYDRFRLAEDIETLVEQMMTSCRHYLRSLDKEVELQR